MKRPGLVLAVLAVLAMASTAVADDRFRAELSGYNEVHFLAGNPTTTPPTLPALRGAISTAARGSFRATIDEDQQTIHYRLSYSGLEANVTQAHIHFGQPHTVGGIVVWLCQTVGTPAPSTPVDLTPVTITPLCPGLRDGIVTGTITPNEVLTVTGQGIAAGEFDELVRAIRAGATYANVHSETFTPGEIRGHILGRLAGKILDLLDGDRD